MNQPIFNPWAPPYLNGFNQYASDCEDRDGAYTWPNENGFQSIAAGGRLLTQSIVLEQEDEFVFQGFIWSMAEPGGRGFLYRIQDEAGNWISDSLTLCWNTPGTLASPAPRFPHVTYKRGQQILFDIVNADPDAAQAFQLVFRGLKRYRRSQ